VTVPLLDLHAQHEAIREELDAAIAGVLAHGRFVGGPDIARFEEEFAAYCRAGHCVGCASGTDALTLALRVAGVGSGDEVITTAMTFIATVESIVSVGATPVLVDCDPDTALMDAATVEAVIGPRTAAIVVVHLYGQPVDLGAFRRLADRRGLLLFEDAAQAHGAEWDGLRVGSVGDAASFSFFPGKNLGALGDGGAVVTSNAGWADSLRRLRDHGRRDKYSHEFLGVNSRLDSLQAAVLSAKLRHLDAWNQARVAHADAYDAVFADSEWVRPIRRLPQAASVFHQYVVRVASREHLQERLAAAGCQTGVHYPLALNRQPALSDRVALDGYPNADRLAGSVLSLPVFPELSADERDAVSETLLAEAGARTLDAVAPG
jgi:dTDP-4-amino-4,6-dideoxygalactose transaminase